METLDHTATAAAPEGLAPPRSRWRQAAQPAALAGMIAAGCTYIAIQNPNQSSLYPQCPLKAMTGIDCPGCGITRSLYALLHGDVASALSHNLLFVLALPLIVYALVRWGADRMGYQLPSLPRWRPWMTVVGVVAVLAFGVARNLSGAPLAWLDAAA